MKLCYVLLLSLAAVVAADSTGYYPEQEYYPEQGAAPSNYYGQRRRPQSGLAGLVKRVFAGDDNRRQFTGTGTGLGNVGGGIGGLLNPEIIASFALPTLLIIGGAVFVAFALASLDFNSSGRGLDTDDWEVDHSVWMNQLQKDFEDSWSTE